MEVITIIATVIGMLFGAIIDLPSIFTIVVIFLFRGLLASLVAPFLVTTVVALLLKDGYFSIRLISQLLVAATAMRIVTVWMVPAYLEEDVWRWNARRNEFQEDVKSTWKKFFYLSVGIGLTIGALGFLGIVTLESVRPMDTIWDEIALLFGILVFVVVLLFGGISLLMFAIVEFPILVAEELKRFLITLYKSSNFGHKRSSGPVDRFTRDAPMNPEQQNNDDKHAELIEGDFQEYKDQYFKEVKRLDPEGVEKGVHWLELMGTEGIKRAFKDKVAPASLAEIILSTPKITDLQG